MTTLTFKEALQVAFKLKHSLQTPVDQIASDILDQHNVLNAMVIVYNKGSDEIQVGLANMTREYAIKVLEFTLEMYKELETEAKET